MEFLSDGREHDDSEIGDTLIRRFGVDESKYSVIKKTGRPKFRNEIDWVKGDLGDEGRGKKYIRQVAEKKYQILPLGLAALRQE